MHELITPPVLKELVAARTVHSAFVVGEEGGFAIFVKYGMVTRAIAAKSSTSGFKKRVFPSLDSVDRFLRTTVHIPQYEVNSASYKEAPRSAKGESAAERMKNIHKTSVYNSWLETELQASIDDTSKPVPHASVMQGMHAIVTAAKEKEAMKATGKRAKAKRAAD